LFGVCEQTIANYNNLAREDFHKNLVPKFINYNDRSVLTAHNTPIAKTLFDIPDDKTCSIFDTTYCLTQKLKKYGGKNNCGVSKRKCHSSNQMVSCSSSVGYFLFFDATHNDATYYKIILVDI